MHCYPPRHKSPRHSWNNETCSELNVIYYPLHSYYNSSCWFFFNKLTVWAQNSYGNSLDSEAKATLNKGGDSHQYQNLLLSSKNNECRGVWEKGGLLHCWWECKLLQPLWKTVWRLLKKPKRELPCDPVIPLLDIRADKTRTRKRMHPYAHSSAVSNSQDTEQPKFPSTEAGTQKM